MSDSAGLGRRYDVDWIRIIAIGLLVVYHMVITFQPWAPFIFFIGNQQTLDWLWPFMELLNIWRIPILFLVSGMGVRFAMERRNARQLLADRTLRILVPLAFGVSAVAPFFVLFGLLHFNLPPAFIPNMAHLWFLANIYIYVFVMLPLFVHIRRNPDGAIVKTFARITRHPIGLLVLAVPAMIEAWLVPFDSYSTYAWQLDSLGNMPHSLILGAVWFLVGFLVVSTAQTSWKSMEKARFIALGIAVALGAIRNIGLIPDHPEILRAFESTCWIVAVVGLAARGLNKQSRAVSYLSGAVYPVYIFHLPVQQGLALVIVPFAIPAIVKLILLVVLTLAISVGLYEAVKRLPYVKLLFGITQKARHKK